jgi:uncharacterized protein (DUF2249 family)
MTTTSATPVIDIRTMGPCVERKAHVLAAFDRLGRGESLIVVNDHLPRGLYAHFQEHRAGLFRWMSLEDGPVTFRIEIEHA